MTDLPALVRGLGHPTVVVVGDVMLDRYVFGRVERVSPEAPIQVLQVRREESRPGGAASVATDLRALGATVRLVGFLGEDESGATLLRLLGEEGVDVRLVTTPGRPTTLKTRMVAGRGAGHQQVLRVDREDASAHAADMEASLLAAYEVALDGADGVVISDYAKGVVSVGVAGRVIELARGRGLPVVVDPKGREYGRYAGATVVTPNRPEAQTATGRELTSRDSILAAGRELLDLAGVEHVVVTLDKDGMAIVSRDGGAELVSTTPREVYDVTGAGDVVTATLGFALADGLSLSEGVHLANVAAGVEVGKVGAVPVTREQILVAAGAVPAAAEHVLTTESLLDELAPIRAGGRRVVFTNGCFDLLHAGHVRYLQAARREGDVLVVGLNSDASVRRLKGPRRPLVAQDDRAEVLASLECVDFVVLFDDDTPLDLVTRLLPDVIVKGEDWREKGVVGSDVVERNGGRVVLVPLAEGRSTTNLVDRIRGVGADDSADPDDAVE